MECHTEVSYIIRRIVLTWQSIMGPYMIYMIYYGCYGLVMDLMDREGSYGDMSYLIHDTIVDIILL